MPKITRTLTAPDLPTLTRTRTAAAVRDYYEDARLVDGPGLQMLVLHSEPDDRDPLTAFVVVLPETPLTSAWIEHLNTHAAHLWDILVEWNALQVEAEAAARGRR